jgi:hypothetical protein
VSPSSPHTRFTSRRSAKPSVTVNGVDIDFDSADLASQLQAAMGVSFDRGRRDALLALRETVKEIRNKPRHAPGEMDAFRVCLEAWDELSAAIDRQLVEG